MGCPALSSIGPGDQYRPSGGTCVFSQVVGQAPAGTQIQATLDVTSIYTGFGGGGGGQPPQPQDIVNQLFAQGAHQVFYMEIWQVNYQVNGAGWVDFDYITLFN